MSVVTHAQGFPASGGIGANVGASVAASGNISVTTAVAQLVPFPVRKAIVGVLIQSRSTNAAIVYIGPSTMSVAGDGGVELRAGSSIFYPISEVDSLYAVAASGTMTVAVHWV